MRVLKIVLSGVLMIALQGCATTQPVTTNQFHDPAFKTNFVNAISNNLPQVENNIPNNIANSVESDGNGGLIIK